MLHTFKCPPRPGTKFPDGCDIPRNSRLYIASLPHRNVVFDGRASRSASVDLDPGKYVARIHWSTDNDGRSNTMTWQFEFFVGMTEKVWKEHVGKRPRFSKAIQGTEGPRWSCGFMGCEEEFQTQIGMVEHEYLHYGVKLFDSTEGMQLVGINKSMSDLAQTIEGQKKGVPTGHYNPSEPILPPVTKVGTMPPMDSMMPVGTPDNVPFKTGVTKRPERRTHEDEG